MRNSNTIVTESFGCVQSFLCGAGFVVEEDCRALVGLIVEVYFARNGISSFTLQIE
jgi:hypothetical protein